MLRLEEELDFVQGQSWLTFKLLSFFITSLLHIGYFHPSNTYEKHYTYKQTLCSTKIKNKKLKKNYVALINGCKRCPQIMGLFFEGLYIYIYISPNTFHHFLQLLR